ncbi:MAG: helix-turn-helix transcriptional regulator [Pseudomonadales bacterium]|nr:helix-turn-helix transcriptional regulator [Pseudomonadales bacterium]MBL6814685.1 helix-turn-helix transcriptional regulator [Pseudomonadales bacterium]
MSSLHQRITKARKSRRLSQANFAERLGVTRTACSHWETGRAKPSTKHIEKIAKLLAVDANWLITGVKDKRQPTAELAAYNLAYEGRASYLESFDKETQKVAADYFSLSIGQRKLVRDLIKALNS